MHCLPTLLHGAPTTLHARTVGPFGLPQVSGTHACCCNDRRHRFGNLGQGFGRHQTSLSGASLSLNTPPLPLLPRPDHPPVSTFFRASTLCLPHFPLLSLFFFLLLSIPPLPPLGPVSVVAVMHSLTDAHRHTTSCIRRAASSHSHTSSQGVAPTRVLARG